MQEKETQKQEGESIKETFIYDKKTRFIIDNSANSKDIVIAKVIKPKYAQMILSVLNSIVEKPQAQQQQAQETAKTEAEAK